VCLAGQAEIGLADIGQKVHTFALFDIRYELQKYADEGLDVPEKLAEYTISRENVTYMGDRDSAGREPPLMEKGVVHGKECFIVRATGKRVHGCKLGSRECPTLNSMPTDALYTCAARRE